MKKYRVMSIAAASLLLTATSCSLDEYNPSGNTPENEWTSAAGYERR